MPPTTGRHAVVLTTAGSDEQAEQLARELVDRRLAACVNIVGQVCSVYRWKGEVTREGEKLLVIKTRTELFPRLQQAIQELHSYEVPEVLMLPVLDGSPSYLEWLDDQVG